MKTDQKDFVDILKPNLIFCLQETKGTIKLEDYHCYNKLREGSASGGVCTGIHRSISGSVKEFRNTGSSDIQAFTISKRTFKTKKDILLINIYNSPSNSSFKLRNNEAVDVLDTLAEFINSNLDRNKCDLLLLGDLNARIGTKEDLPTQPKDDTISNGGYHMSHHRDDNSNLPHRASEDVNSNTNGDSLLDLTYAHDLIIANGRTLGDIQGRYTCLKWNGNSVIDYAIANRQLYDSIEKLQIHDLTEFSDHRPMSVSLDLRPNPDQVREIPDSCFTEQPLGFTWSAKRGAKSAFTEAQKHLTSAIESILKEDCSGRKETESLCRKVTSIFHQIASKSLPRKKKSNFRSKNRWFDSECRASKRKFRTSTILYSQDPTNDEKRSQYRADRNAHKALINKKKTDSNREINRKLLEDGRISWGDFKNLKRSSTPVDTFDKYDLHNFYTFFKDLYAKKNLDANRINDLEKWTEAQQMLNDVRDVLDKHITLEELEAATKTLNTGKSTSSDLISNEMLINSSQPLRMLMLKLFNACLANGVCPWKESVMTPLLKKGDPYDPDNYRSICVGSCLGKLFSCIFLSRLLSFRKENCPDVPNQLGFCAEAQTSDHLLTLSTIIEKYTKKQNKRLYACFVDYAKAFDSVVREALMYKLSCMGVGGNYMKVIRDMYNKSTTRVKLIKKLSEAITILVGTEQGHPMSPELFKVFLHELSLLLNAEMDNSPELNGLPVNHLLWADDLVLLSLHQSSLQKLLDILGEYCTKWGLNVNSKKTQIMVFNKQGRLLKVERKFTIGDKTIEQTRNYTYLGLTLSLSGSFTQAMDDRRKKSLGAFFSLKRCVDMRFLSPRALLKLYDSLIRPVLTYGCQVWFHTTKFSKVMLADHSPHTRLLQQIAQDPCERAHLQMLKWTLGTHKRSSNVATWGETGRYPICAEVIKQVLTYKRRIEDNIDSSSFVYHALKEQIKLKLSWFTTLSELETKFYNQNPLSAPVPTRPSPISIKHGVRRHFVEKWLEAVNDQPKLRFYKLLKSTFDYEPYLDLPNASWRKATSRLRCSSHTLNIETGRYIDQSDQRLRLCEFCRKYLQHDIIEDEAHLLTVCPLYHAERSRLPDATLTLLLRNEYHDLNFADLNLSKFISGSFQSRKAWKEKEKEKK